MTKRAVGETLQKGQQQKKKRDKQQRKDAKKLTKKGPENRRLHRVKILKYTLERH